jgi:tetratricopeptide (TPR) repeat protein
MKIILFLLIAFPFISFSQMTESDIRRMAKTASEPELIIESSSLILEKKYFLADIIVDRLLEIDPKSANYNYRKGLLLLNSNLDYKNAIIHFEKALPQADKDFDLYDGHEDLKSRFSEIANNDDLSVEEKSHEIAAYLDEKWGLYDGYMEVIDYLEELFMDEV